MSWFQLDPQSIAARVRSRAPQSKLPSLETSTVRGILGFTTVSLAGFVPWAVFGRQLYKVLGEAGLYAVCALVFIGLSGILLHRLILGPGSLPRFYKLFSIAFTAYSIAWIAGWMVLRGHPGSIVGLLAGTAVMGWIFSRAFDAQRSALKIIAVLFVLNTAGYFVGGWLEAVLITKNALVAKLMWGVWYGAGLGAGLGVAFHLCQTAARRELAATAPPEETAK